MKGSPSPTSRRYDSGWQGSRSAATPVGGAGDRGRGGPRPLPPDDPEPIELPVAHGEGQYVAADPSAGRVVLRYADAQGQPTDTYPDNPNGSPGGVAGLCDSTGRIFGLMPHPERHVDPLHHPRWTRRGPKSEGDGLRIFRNAVAAVS